MPRYGIRLSIASKVIVPMVEIRIAGSSIKYLPFVLKFVGDVIFDAVKIYGGMAIVYTTEEANYPFLDEDEEMVVRFMLFFKTQAEVEKYLDYYFIPAYKKFCGL